ncbi:hypothetical protein F511_36440 [Dorcoceras hygrometricum]|uniref:Uncharacterized protein n=1 Tax=Dorcoceras hygrometricum TaxID=472368 RepID=A0A2Z7A444_9LAMI|nr:hypothetical protein F511_36440 [Dorcoceras hygrometricum]
MDRVKKNIKLVHQLGTRAARDQAQKDLVKSRTVQPQIKCIVQVLTHMRCLNGSREQANNTVAVDENNRAKLVKDKPARPEAGQLGEENWIGRSGQAGAQERDEAAGRMISVRPRALIRLKPLKTSGSIAKIEPAHKQQTMNTQQSNIIPMPIPSRNTSSTSVPLQLSYNYHTQLQQRSPSNTDPPPAKTTQATAQIPKYKPTAAGSYHSTSPYLPS